jgi:acetylornithine deacetylase/succinyl-diaminopimelate desuccinylase
VDRRINPEEDLAAEKQRLFQLFDRLRGQGVDLEVEILQEGGSSGTSEEDPVARALAESVAAATGKPAAFEMCAGFLETRFYAQQGIPALAYGPGLLSVSHGPGEFVWLKDVYDCTAVYALSAARLLGRTQQPA